MMTMKNGDEQKEVVIAQIDVPLFLAFKEHYKDFVILCNAGVFGLPFGKAIINKHEGRIQSVVLEQRTYQYLPVEKPIHI